MNKSLLSPRELFWTFLRLGIIGFGGPVAHIALMREEFVLRRKLISEQDFFDLVSATQLIPGPNSTELAIHLGHRFGGMRGLLIAGIAFIFPAFLIVLAIAAFYEQWGSLPILGQVLNSVRPVIVGIIFLALISFRKSALAQRDLILFAIITLVLSYLGLPEIFVLIVTSGLYFLWKEFIQTTLISVAAPLIFFYFLKVGSVLFGSGYVLFAFFKSELVDQRHWLTLTQLMDAITVGQVTPGPVFTTATFVGYLLGKIPGAILATIGIFLPSFVFVFISAPFLDRLRSSKRFTLFLNGINAASFALMLKVTFELVRESHQHLAMTLFGVLSTFLIFKFKLNSTWFILAAAIIGFFL